MTKQKQAPTTVKADDRTYDLDKLKSEDTTVKLFNKQDKGGK